MSAQRRLPRQFYERPTLGAARDLLGRVLVRRLADSTELRGRIVETEAYLGANDSASHASRGKTERTAPMFGPAGHAYVYFIYGMHHCFNVVTESDGVAGAVLVRALEPLTNVERMRANRRNKRPSEVSNGPAKLCEALAIDTSLTGEDLVSSERLWLERGHSIPDSVVERTARVGIDYADEVDRTALWRFSLKGSEWVSQ